MSRLFVVISMLLLTATSGWCVSPAPPDLTEIKLIAATGETLTADQIGKDQGVLLVLINNGNPGSITMLDFLAGLKPPLFADRTLVVISGASDKLLQSIAKKYPQLAVSWYCDQESALIKKLKVASTPAVLGVRKATMAWNMVGVSDPALLEKTMRGWLNR